MLVLLIKFKETVVKFILVSRYLAVYTIDVPNVEILIGEPAERGIDHTERDGPKFPLKTLRSVSCLVDLASLNGVTVKKKLR